MKQLITKLMYGFLNNKFWHFVMSCWCMWLASDDQAVIASFVFHMLAAYFGMALACYIFQTPEEKKERYFFPKRDISEQIEEVVE